MTIVALIIVSLSLPRDTLADDGVRIRLAKGLFVALLVPTAVGTTLLGILSVSAIRRSGGRLHGLGLALFDALLFPLLILDGGVLVLCYGVVARVSSFEAVRAKPNHAVTLGLGIMVCVLLDLLLVRRAWRAASRASPIVQE